jgi:hypothetical protein
MATKTPNGHKTPNEHKNKPNGHKIYQQRPSKIYPNRDFWFENIPSGNPA